VFGAAGVISDAISHGDFIGMEEDYQTLLNFSILARKRQITHLFTQIRL